MLYFNTESFVHDENDENILLYMEHSQKNNEQDTNNNVNSNDPKETHTTKQDSKPIKITKTTPKYEVLQPFFGWLPMDISKKTFKRTTQ